MVQFSLNDEEVAFIKALRSLTSAQRIAIIRTAHALALHKAPVALVEPRPHHGGNVTTIPPRRA